MKKTLLSALIVSSLSLVGCGSGESEKAPLNPAKEVKQEAKKEVKEDAKKDAKKDAKSEAKKVELPKVKTQAKPLVARKEVKLAVDNLLAEKAGAEDKLVALIKAEKEKGSAFVKQSKEEVEALKGMAKEEYEMQLEEYQKAFSALEVFVSDKYVDTKKQSFYFSDFVTLSTVAFAEVQFDDESKEVYFVLNEGGKWSPYETKKEKAEREKKLKDLLAKLQKVQAEKSEKEDKKEDKK